MPEHLALVVCGAPLAARCHDVAARAVEAGWVIWVVATSSTMKWIDATQVEQVTGCAVLMEQRQAGQAKRFPPPAQVIVCPATFNTVNKLAAGIMDNYAAGLLCEAPASQTPMIVAPMVSTRLWPHPVWQRNLEMLAAAGGEVRRHPDRPHRLAGRCPSRYRRRGHRRLRPRLGAGPR